jgi:hypothetical protein
MVNKGVIIRLSIIGAALAILTLVSVGFIPRLAIKRKNNKRENMG